MSELTDVAKQQHLTGPGEILRSRLNEAVERWEAAVRSDISAARQQSERILKDSVPEFLKALATALSNGQSVTEACLTYSRVHGRDRAIRDQYTLGDTVREYNHLRRVLIDLAPWSAHEMRLIHNSIDFAIAEAADGFHQTSLALERLEQEKLHVTMRDLDSERGMREKFVVALTHDLRTPLSAIKMASEMLMGRSTDDLVKRIVTNCNRLDRMIQDLLDANFIRAGKQLSIQRSNVDLFKLATDAVDCMTLIYKRDIQLTGTHVEGNWDRFYLTRAIENLLSNAIKYGSPAGAIRVTVSESDESASLTVYNEGPAIPKEHLSSLFDQFSRITDNENVKKIGWGIGLTLVRGAIEAHGGRIQVKSPMEQGTEFVFALPKRAAAKEP